MTEQLVEQKCDACRSDAAKVTPAEVSVLKPQIPDWAVVRVEGVDQLTRQFKFDNFVEALAFTNKVGEVAEEQGHHPAIVTEWGKVRVNWWTHKIKGLHANDFIMAAKTDRIFGAMG